MRAPCCGFSPSYIHPSPSKYTPDYPSQWFGKRCGGNEDLFLLSDYNCVTDILRNCAYNGGMPATELNRENHEFTHSGANYWIYTFMTREGVLHYRVWRKMDEGQATLGEARADLIQRLKNQLDQPPDLKKERS